MSKLPGARPIFWMLDAAGEPQPCSASGTDTLWNEWIAVAEQPGPRCRYLRADDVRGHRVSTVFLGIDHDFAGEGPVLWETMVFCSDRCAWSDSQRRFRSKEDALAHHAWACESLGGARKLKLKRRESRSGSDARALNQSSTSEFKKSKPARFQEK